MTVVGNAGALVYPWIQARLLVAPSLFVSKFVLMGATVGVMVLL